MKDSTKITILVFFGAANSANTLLDFESQSNFIQIPKKVLAAIGAWGGLT